MSNWLKFFMFFLLCHAISYGQASAQNVLLDELGSGSIEQDIKPADVIKFNPVSAIQSSANIISLNFNMLAEQGWTIYKSKLSFEPPAGFVVNKVTYPEATVIDDPMSDEKVEVISGGSFDVELKSLSPLDAKNLSNISFGVRFLGCTSRICLFPYTQLMAFPLTAKTQNDSAPLKNVEPGITLQPESKIEPPLPEHPVISPAPETSQSLDSLQSSYAKKIQSGELPLHLLILIVFLAGIATNLTPCVLPMVPITIRILTSKKSTHPVLSPVFYAAGILITYTGLGVIAGLTGSLFGSFMASPAVNWVLAILMFVFALSMLGYFNFTSLQTFGNKISSQGGHGLGHVLIMGAAAGFVAAPCTGPILAALLTYTASSGDQTQAVTLMTTYSFGFALPYVFLGIFAKKLASFKSNPKLMLSTKYIFSTIMLALGFYYLRIPFYGVVKQLSQHWQLLGLLFLGFGITTWAFLYLPFAYKTDSRWGKNLSQIASISMLGFSLFSFSQHVAGVSEPPSSGTPGSIQPPPLQWVKDKEQGCKEASDKNGFVLMDAWAEWCEACKKMDRTTFVDADVLNYLKENNWVAVKLDMTEMNDNDIALQESYGISGLPSLILSSSSCDISESKVLSGFIDAQTLIEELSAFSQKIN